MTKRTHADIRRALKTGDWTVVSIIAIVKQLLAESEAWEKAALSHGTAQTLAIEAARKLKGVNNG